MGWWHYTDVMTWVAKPGVGPRMSSRCGEQVYHLRFISTPHSIVRELASEPMVRVYTILIKYPVNEW